MSRFSGPQGRGAARRSREQRRREAQARNALTPPQRRRAARRACPTGKVKYRNEHDARVGLVGAVIGKNRGDQRRHERRVYECPHCAGWHLTSAAYRPARSSPLARVRQLIRKVAAA